MRHTSVYEERQHKAAKSLDEAIKRLRATVDRRARDVLAKRYPFRGSARTAAITRRIVGERD